jgi:hypothetical protein
MRDGLAVDRLSKISGGRWVRDDVVVVGPPHLALVPPAGPRAAAQTHNPSRRG